MDITSVLQNDADWTVFDSMEGERTRNPGRLTTSNWSPDWLRRLSKHEEKRWNASRGSDTSKKTVGNPERRICPQPRQSKSAWWLLWESWASNRGVVDRLCMTFFSRHPFSYSSDSEKHEQTVSVLCLLPPIWLLARVPISCSALMTLDYEHQSEQIWCLTHTWLSHLQMAYCAGREVFAQLGYWWLTSASSWALALDLKRSWCALPSSTCSSHAFPLRKSYWFSWWAWSGEKFLSHARLPWLCPDIGSRKLTNTLRSLHPFAKPRNLISSVARVAPSFDLTFLTMAPSATRCWQHREYVKRKMGCRQVG